MENVKEEKTSAIMLTYNRLRSAAKLFRFVELCLALVFLLWIFTRLPFAVRISGEYFQKLAGIVTSPLFVVLLCNGIIGALFAKSGGFSAENPAEAEVYEEFIENSVENSENRGVKLLSADSAAVANPPSLEAEEIVFQDKEIICQESAISISDASENDIDKESESDTPKPYRRSKSEKLKRESSEMAVEKLRRSETEKFRKSKKSDEIPDEDLLPSEDLSDEEFQKAIDDFIAKHLKFRRQESIAIVVPNQA
ncbi:hypothetical protein HS088_TW01G00914 [Tripterygium wilfordii]|uniref:Uncharacterized protein n=1 Tax=Tripterygium wilfordii TaxID=458696 RepID=A0A7J7E3Z3_TRIWF|nr:uncharacterized protein LOC119996617 [Tripterygium wilfordii]KAF5752996.1 hypothetical protein HS088_TW01G00914 [Tripterygium wilfordii]